MLQNSIIASATFEPGAGLVAQSKTTAVSIEEFAGVFGGHIQALARAHDQITNLNWAPVALRSLVKSESGRLSRSARRPTK